MTTPARLPIHREYDRALDQLADVRAALGRAGYSDPDTTAAQLVDQLAGKLRALAQDYADATSESLSDVAAMRGIRIRLGSPAGSTQGTTIEPAESHAQARIGPGRDRDTTYPPIGMQAFLDHSTAEWRAARTADERVEVVRDLLEGWHDRWDAYYATAVTDEYDGIARHLVALLAAADARQPDPYRSSR